MSETRAVPVEYLANMLELLLTDIATAEEIRRRKRDDAHAKDELRFRESLLLEFADTNKGALLTALRAASPPQGEPVAWRRWENEMWIYYETNAWPDCIPLYAHPPTAPQAMNPLKMIGGEHPASCVCFICKPPELKAAPQVEGLEQFETIRRLATTLDGTVCYQGDVLRHEAIALYRQYVRECDKAAARIALAENIAHRAEHRANQLESDLAQEQAAREAAEKDAARYRWLRDTRIYDAPSGSLVELWLFSRPTGTAGSFDRAIDAALDAAERTK